ncbi:MAG: 4'-phosphopantetheinyl transferase superfamily protein [Rhizobiaceae bacterium]
MVLDCDPQDLAFTWSDGMPTLIGFEDFHFSTSYSGGKMAVACSDVAIGIDLELTATEPSDQDVADNLFHPRELNQLHQTPDADWATVFYSIWTQKEALAKALGTGFGIEFSNFCVSAKGGLIESELTETENLRWYSQAVTIADGYVLAIACPQPIEQLSIEQFQDV